MIRTHHGYFSTKGDHINTIESLETQKSFSCYVYLFFVMILHFFRLSIMGWSGMGGGESAKREEEELKRKLAAQRKPSRKERNHTLLHSQS